MRLLTLWFLLVLIGSSLGCGRSSTGKPAAIPLPPEYVTLASQLGQDMKLSAEELHTNFASDEVFNRLEEGVASLENIKTNDQELTSMAERGHAALKEILAVQRELQAASNDNSVRWWDTLGHVQNAVGTFRLLDGLASGWRKMDAVHADLPRIAVKYAASPSKPDGRMLVDVDAAWGCHGPDDWMKILNPGPSDLSNCTIQVTLIGKDDQRRTNVHFIRHWPADSWMNARYENGGIIPTQPDAGRTKVDNLQRAEIIIWSPKYSTVLNYQYEGEQKDQDIARWCHDLKLAGRYQPFVKGLLWNTERGVEFSLEGIESIPAFTANVTFRSGTTSKGLLRYHDGWKRGKTKAFIPTQGELTFDPTHIDVELSFAGTKFRYKTTMAVK